MYQPERTAHQHLPENQGLESEGSDKQSDSVRSLTRQPGSPSASFAGPAQLQAAPGQNAPMQLTPSKEVPDLDEAVVEKVNKFLAAGKKQEAINTIMAALAIKDPAKFNLGALDGGKVHFTYSASAHAALGPKAKKWLSGMLAKGPKEIKTDEGEMRKYLDTLAMPADQLDFHVEISDNFCNNAANLYSSIRHEFVHVEQKRRDPFKYLSTSEIGSGYANPSTKYQHGMNEFEAYGWEEANMASTGLDQRPNDVWNVYSQLADHGPSRTSDPDNNKKWKGQLANLWKTAFTGLLTRAEAAIVQAKAGKLDATGQQQLDKDHYKLKDLWGYRDNHKLTFPPFEARYKAVNLYYEGKEFAALLKKSEAEIKTAKPGYDGFNIWRPLHNKWINLDAATKKAYLAEYTRIMPAIWAKTFDLFVSKIETLFAEDPKAWKRAIDDYIWRCDNMFLNTKTSMVSDETVAAKKEILKALKLKIK